MIWIERRTAAGWHKIGRAWISIEAATAAARVVYGEPDGDNLRVRVGR